MRNEGRMQNAECRMWNPASRRSPLAARPSTGGFTMIEIAISLAIIGFALVAIIGVLPIGMNVQKDNREETIINQEASVLLDAIRNSAQGMDDLTNYVVAITNRVTEYSDNGKATGGTWLYGYTMTKSSMSPQFPLINGFRIVGLLSTPKYIPYSGKGGSGYLSNNVTAYVRSMSGSAYEKFPQNNPSVQDLAFSYRMTSEVVPYGTNYYDPSWTHYGGYATNTPEYAARLNYAMVVNNLNANLHDVRLTFRWPLRSQGQLGPGGQAFRTLVGGQLIRTNDLSFPLRPEYDLYFFQPRTYVKAP
jgi:type II secretory pathway pseudopilin PulG